MNQANSLDAYFSGETHEIRVALLAGLASSGECIPPDVVVGLLRLELPSAEKVLLLEVVSSADPVSFEDFVFDHMIHWPQDVAAKALRIWAGNPACTRWNELSRLAALPGLPQRILYTILDVSVRAPDQLLTKACVDSAMHADDGGLSPAFNSLMFVRMMQRKIQDGRVSALVRKICEKSAQEFVPEDKSAFAACLYLWCFHKDEFDHWDTRVPAGSPQSILRFLPNDRSVSWLGGGLKSRVTKETMSARPKNLHGPSDGDGAGEFLGWLLSKDVSASRIKSLVSGVWQQLLVVGDVDEPDDRWTAATNSLRGKTGIYRIACIRALGKRRGSDLAVLKLLDYVRSGDTNELTEVARALGSIASPRAIQELISMMSRHNAGVDLQLEIAVVLKNQKLDDHHDAIGAARLHVASLLKSSRGKNNVSEGLAEVLEALQDLVVAPVGLAGPVGAVDARMMDEALARSIPHYERLSAEVKRALRTAWYFHRQIELGGAAASIDLSPVIDMQYKAMELLFREYFEDVCGRLIQQGTIQRKLDLIGYSRPIQDKMDEFESYIAAMPVINTIPFFSKFKMRKMLMALCQFKPGRRFTLDGLKAFGLFFFIFGRGECRYGLGGVLPIVPGPFRDQAALADFCRLLHVFQDFRNRAAHEGFHPDAAADINGIWCNTAEIVQLAHALRPVLSRPIVEPGLVRGRAS